jgi:hypothetical protein
MPSQSKWTGQERREQPRVRLSLAAELRFSDHTCVGRLRDLSTGGTYFEVDGFSALRPERQGSLFAPSLGAAATPVHVRNRRVVAGAVGGVGLEFGELEPAVDACIREQIASRRYT